jgi:flagellar basal body P-ring protein FlgI
MQQRKLNRLILVVISLFACIYGCNTSEKATAKKVIDVDTQAVFEGTIGSLVDLDGFQGVQVEGFGIVFGLSATGSRECPKRIRQYIAETLQRPDIQTMKDKLFGKVARFITPDEIIKSRNTAIVRVRGIVPATAPRGVHFDVQVEALEGTQTTSLENGKLVICDLRQVLSGIVGKPQAVAQGLLFVSPFVHQESDDNTERIEKRRALIVGGGLSFRSRAIKLILRESSSRMASQIQRRINARFSEGDRLQVAVGLNNEIIEINIPQSYTHRADVFIALLLATYLNDSTVYINDKFEALNNLAKNPQANFQRISLAWESIGRQCLPYLQELYTTNASTDLVFYGALTALRLGDKQGINQLLKIALQQQHKWQKQAVRILVEFSDDPKALHTLTLLLGNEDPIIRMQAYRGVRLAEDDHITALTFKSGLLLDIVASGGKPMIAVWADEEARIVLFGKSIRCEDRIFYETFDGKVIIATAPNKKDVQLTIMTGVDGRFVTKRCKGDLAGLIAALSGPMRDLKTNKLIGPSLSLSQIVGVVHEWCSKSAGVINASFSTEKYTKDTL